MKVAHTLFSAALVIALAGCAHHRAPDAALANSIIAEPAGGSHALQLLKEGNDRFVRGQAEGPATDVDTLRIAAEDGQRPFVTIFTCSDSRVPVERVFDRGFGEIFVVRVAGNVTAAQQTGSVEFSLSKLKVPLLVVMGHTKCGAVQAACAGARVTPNIDSFIMSIEPAVQKVRGQHPGATPEELEKLVTQENVRQTLRDLYANSPLIREKVSSGTVQVALAVVDVSNGRVDWIGDAPKPDAK